MKKKIAIVAGLVVVGGIVLMGLAPKLTKAQAKQSLAKTWEVHSQRDAEFRGAFFSFAHEVAAKNVEVREKFEHYKQEFEIADDNELVHLIFLLRRTVDKDALYDALEKWNLLSTDTHTKVIANIGPTYKVIANGSLSDNQEVVKVLEQRRVDRDATVAGLPVSFQKVIHQISQSDLDVYLECLYLMMLNTVAVRNYLGETSASAQVNPAARPEEL